MSIYDWRPFVFGGLASVTAEIATYPLDMVKARLQVQGQQLGHLEIRYNGLVNAMNTIVRQEGFFTLYNGIKPALLRQATYGTLKIGFYQTLKGLSRKHGYEETLPRNIAFAMLSGGLAIFISNPTDLLKVRMQVKKDEYNNRGMMRVFKDIFEKEGLRGLYRGAMPNVNRTAIITGIELPVYDYIKSILILKYGLDKKHISCHLIASSIAGLLSAIACTPVDVIKTRMMSQKKLKSVANDQQIYKNSFDCVWRTVKYEGFSALYKGFLPSYLRLGPWNMLFFITYEQFQRLSTNG